MTTELVNQSINQSINKLFKHVEPKRSSRLEIVLRIMVNFIFCQILTEIAVFTCQNGLFGAKLCPGSGTDLKDLATSLVVFTYEAP